MFSSCSSKCPNLKIKRVTKHDIGTCAGADSESERASKFKSIFSCDPGTERNAHVMPNSSGNNSQDNKCQENIIRSCAEFLDITQELVTETVQNSIRPVLCESMDTVEQGVEAICVNVAKNRDFLEQIFNNFTAQINDVLIQNNEGFKYLCNIITEQGCIKQRQSQICSGLDNLTLHTYETPSSQGCIQSHTKSEDEEPIYSAKSIRPMNSEFQLGSCTPAKKSSLKKPCSICNFEENSSDSADNANENLWEWDSSVDKPCEPKLICGKKTSSYTPSIHLQKLKSQKKDADNYRQSVLCGCLKNQFKKGKSRKKARVDSVKHSYCDPKNLESIKIQIQKGKSKKKVIEDSISDCYAVVQIPKRKSRKKGYEDSTCGCSKNSKSNEKQTQCESVDEDFAQNSICCCCTHTNSKKIQFQKQYVKEDLLCNCLKNIESMNQCACSQEAYLKGLLASISACTKNKKSNKMHTQKETSPEYVDEYFAKNSICCCSRNKNSKEIQFQERKYIKEDLLCDCLKNLEANQIKNSKTVSEHSIDASSKDVPLQKSSASICACSPEYVDEHFARNSICCSSRNNNSKEIQFQEKKYIKEDLLCDCLENVEANQIEISKKVSEHSIDGSSNDVHLQKSPASICVCSDEHADEHFAKKSICSRNTNSKEDLLCDCLENIESKDGDSKEGNSMPENAPKRFCQCYICLCSKGGIKYPSRDEAKACNCIEQKKYQQQDQQQEYEQQETHEIEKSIRVPAGTNLDKNYNYCNTNFCPESPKKIERPATEAKCNQKKRKCKSCCHCRSRAVTKERETTEQTPTIPAVKKEKNASSVLGCSVFDFNNLYFISFLCAFVLLLVWLLYSYM